jgi:hypothetical protein
MNSKELANRIVNAFVRTLPPDDCEATLTSMLENWRLQEINKYVNSCNTETMSKMKQKEVVTKTINTNIERNRAWSRSN